MADTPRCPLSRMKIQNWKRWVIANPGQGNRLVSDPRYWVDTTAILEPGRPIRVMMTFDVGYHSSGWFKNSEWEQNLHLSFSHPKIGGPLVMKLARPEIGFAGGPGRDLKTVSDDEARAWGKAIYGEEHASKAWFEPAASVFDPYRAPNVVHLRLFYDENMQPFIPEGECSDLKPWADGSSPEKIYGQHRAT